MAELTKKALDHLQNFEEETDDDAYSLGHEENRLKQKLLKDAGMCVRNGVNDSLSYHNLRRRTQGAHGGNRQSPASTWRFRRCYQGTGIFIWVAFFFSHYCSPPSSQSNGKRPPYQHALYSTDLGLGFRFLAVFPCGYAFF